MRRRRDIYLEILQTGLLAIRHAAYEGDAARCYAEADHLHNIPGQLRVDDDGTHRHYMDVMRRGYLAAVGDKYDGIYDRLWEELEGTSD